jgi:hypothetical protein
MEDGERSRHRDKERSHKHRHKHDDDRHHHRRKRRRDDDHNDRDTNKPVKTEEREEKSLADQFDEDMWEEKPQETEPKLERQSWMTEDKVDSKSDPFSSFLGGAKKEKKPIEKPPEQPKISSRELNPGYLDPPSPPSKRQDDKNTPPNYTIGDDGSSWRMMKLKNLYAAAKEKMMPVEELAVERMGSLQAFDEAREEEMELERRKRDRRGEGVMKVKVTGELYQQRLAKQQKQQSRRKQHSRRQEYPQPSEPPPDSDSPSITQSDLNKLQAALLRAEMTSSPDVAKLQEEYALAVEKFNTQPSIPEIITLPQSHSTLLPHLSREQSKSENEMTIEDMVKEERATKRASNVDRIARDRRFKNDLEYMDENAERLAAVSKRKEVDLKSMSIQDFKKQQRIMENCPLCYKDDGKLPLAPVVSLGTRTYLSLPTEPELTSDGAMIVPLRHARNLAECDDDEWEEIRVFPKNHASLTVELYEMFNPNVLLKRIVSIILRRCLPSLPPPSSCVNRRPHAARFFQSSPGLLYSSPQPRRIRMGNSQTNNPHQHP